MNKRSHRRRHSASAGGFCCEPLEGRVLFDAQIVDCETTFGNVSVSNSAAFNEQKPVWTALTSTVSDIPSHTELTHAFDEANGGGFSFQLTPNQTAIPDLIIKPDVAESFQLTFTIQQETYDPASNTYPPQGNPIVETLAFNVVSTVP